MLKINLLEKLLVIAETVKNGVPPMKSETTMSFEVRKYHLFETSNKALANVDPHSSFQQKHDSIP
jgi:hypothetical protein